MSEPKISSEAKGKRLRDYCTGLMLPCARKPHAPEWLLIEWPKGEAEPTKYWLSTLPDTIAFDRLVDIAKLRWRIERDYQELKQEVGLGHFEGRGWRGLSSWNSRRSPE